MSDKPENQPSLDPLLVGGAAAGVVGVLYLVKYFLEKARRQELAQRQSTEEQLEQKAEPSTFQCSMVPITSPEQAAADTRLANQIRTALAQRRGRPPPAILSDPTWATFSEKLKRRQA